MFQHLCSSPKLTADIFHIAARYLGEIIFAFGRAIENFPGFKIAIEACSIDWSSVILPSQANQSSPGPVSSQEISGRATNADLEAKCIEDLDEDIHTLCTRAEALQVELIELSNICFV